MTPAGSSLPGATRAAMATPHTHQHVFPALAEQVGHARRFLADILAGYLAADDAVLCLSELASNSVIHSASRQPGGTFTVRAAIDGGGVRVEVEDQADYGDQAPARTGSTATDCRSSASSPAPGASPATAQQAGPFGLSCSVHDLSRASHRQSTTPRR